MVIAAILIAHAVALLWLLWLAGRAPLGWQDEDGFHFDCPSGRPEGQEAAASILSRHAASELSRCADPNFHNGDFPHA